MKLKKNHYHPAALIGSYWGNSNNIKKSRKKEIIKINLLEFYLSLQKFKNCKMSSFYDKTEAANVCYSRIYLEKTENDLSVERIERTFISFVKKYMEDKTKHLNIFNENNNKLAICSYVALLTQRNPLHYNNDDTQYNYFVNSILSIPEIIQYNNTYIVNNFSKTVNFYKDFSFDIIENNSNTTLGIFLGSMTHITSDSNIWGERFLDKLNQLNVFNIALNTKIVLIPLTPHSFLLGVKNNDNDNDNDTKITNIFNLFRTNFTAILTEWNKIQLLVSHEIVINHKDLQNIDKNISINIQHLSDVIAKIQSSLDFNINLLLDKKSIQDNIYIDFKKWKELAIMLNNRKEIPINLQFLNAVQMKKKSKDNLDEIKIKFFIHTDFILKLKFIIKLNGEVYKCISNKEEYYCPNFNLLFDTIIHNHYLYFERIKQKAFLSYHYIPEYNKLILDSRNKLYKYTNFIFNET